ncbi:hypothetical protein [Arvimicrobium flavum]|uniref:hypothetical protein n=1 Tax=Arvimicrobium flavum TaxID=3393320 RepID=UPI00237BF5CE|nr:hypothetical protein [Mesorhizobium shangrilense]
MKIISMLSKLFEPAAATLLHHADDCAAWMRDPLAHPVVAAMSLRELADLPRRGHVSPIGSRPPQAAASDWYAEPAECINGMSVVALTSGVAAVPS